MAFKIFIRQKSESFLLFFIGVLLFPPYGLLPYPVKFLKMPLCNSNFKIRIHVYYFGNPDNSHI